MPPSLILLPFCFYVIHPSLPTFLPSSHRYLPASVHPSCPIPSLHPVSPSPSKIYLNIKSHIKESHLSRFTAGRILALTWPRSSTFGLLTRFISFVFPWVLISLLSSPYPPSSPFAHCLDLTTLHLLCLSSSYAFHPHSFHAQLLPSIPILSTQLSPCLSSHRRSI